MNHYIQLSLTWATSRDHFAYAFKINTVLTSYLRISVPDRAGLLLRSLGKEEEMEEQRQMTLATTSEAPHGFNAN